ncbi:MAG TPA: hypothetical protein VFR85_00380 [Anaeromyxobacteraceae bacterium]|nr:hypothetical protein [Anaeromyxobacteraceae bacterium]
MAIRSIERSGSSVRLVIADELTPADAVRVRDLLQGQPPPARVTIDVRFARSCPAHSLLMLASLRTRAGRPLAFAGLGVAQQKLLGYFDVPAADDLAEARGDMD